jgi:hypothetical protein
MNKRYKNGANRDSYDTFTDKNTCYYCCENINTLYRVTQLQDNLAELMFSIEVHEKAGLQVSLTFAKTSSKKPTGVCALYTVGDM